MVSSASLRITISLGCAQVVVTWASSFVKMWPRLSGVDRQSPKLGNANNETSSRGKQDDHTNQNSRPGEPTSYLDNRLTGWVSQIRSFPTENITSWRSRDDDDEPIWTLCLPQYFASYLDVLSSKTRPCSKLLCMCMCALHRSNSVRENPMPES